MEKKIDSKIEIGKPNHFDLKAVLLINSIGLLPFFMIVGGAIYLTGESDPFLFMAPVLIILFALIGLTIFFFPAFLGNPLVRSIARKAGSPDPAALFFMVGQVALTPRIYTGVRGNMEDADDVGYFQIMEDHLVFTGDHIRFVLPFDRIQKIHMENVGSRGLWVIGARFQIDTDAFEGFTSVEIVERDSCTVFSSRRIAGNLRNRLNELGLKVHEDRSGPHEPPPVPR